MFLLCLVGFTAPYWHVFHGISQREGLFGYKYMSSFLYALGNPVFTICIGLLFNYSTKFIDLAYKKIFAYISVFSITIGCFFLIAVLVPKKIFVEFFGVREYAQWVYYLSMFVIAYLSAIVLKLFQKAIFYGEQKFYKIIEVLFKGYYEDLEEKNLINPNKTDDFKKYRVELTEEAVSHE